MGCSFSVFGFFRAGEITVPSATAYDPSVHLAWGDVAIDSGNPPSKIRVFLKRSKTDQFGRGVTVFLGATGDELCPVAAIVSFAAVRGDAASSFFRFRDGTPLNKVGLWLAFEMPWFRRVFLRKTTPAIASALALQRRRPRLAYKIQPLNHWADGLVQPSCAISEGPVTL